MRFSYEHAILDGVLYESSEWYTDTTWVLKKSAIKKPEFLLRPKVLVLPLPNDWEEKINEHYHDANSGRFVNVKIMPHVDENKRCVLAEAGKLEIGVSFDKYSLLSHSLGDILFIQKMSNTRAALCAYNADNECAGMLMPMVLNKETINEIMRKIR